MKPSVFGSRFFGHSESDISITRHTVTNTPSQNEIVTYSSIINALTVRPANPYPPDTVDFDGWPALGEQGPLTLAFGRFIFGSPGI